MKILTHSSLRTNYLFAGLGILLFAGLIFGFVSASKTAQAEVKDGKLITVHDRGSERSFVTSKSTIGEALKDADVSLNAKDAVEPALDEKLVASDYRVNIYRARPVVVIDGATRQKIVTPYQTAERIAKDAGITLYKEDNVAVNLSDNLLEGAGLQMTISRAQLINVDLFGKHAQMRTQAATVAEFLKEKNITLGADSRVSPAPAVAITSGMALRVWQEGKQTITVDETVEFETEQIKDADRPVGYKEVKTPGKNGSRSVTYEVEIQNGAEVARKEIASVELEPATKQVEIIGSKPKHMPYTGGGSKTEWLSGSVIPQESWGYADFMVGRESGWNPNAINRSSGACGLAQALPCSKVPGNPYNPIDSLNWMNGYVNGRYGGWEGAYSFWQRNHWY